MGITFPKRASGLTTVTLLALVILSLSSFTQPTRGVAVSKYSPPKENLIGVSIAYAEYLPPTESQVVSYIKEVFGKHSGTALKIAFCESSLIPSKVNWKDAEITGMPSQGLFQLNRPYNEAYLDYKYNTDEAYKLFLRRGLQPWSCRKLI